MIDDIRAVRVIQDRSAFTDKLNKFVKKLPKHISEVFGTPRFVIYKNDVQDCTEEQINEILKNVSLPVIVKSQ